MESKLFEILSKSPLVLKGAATELSQLDNTKTIDNNSYSVSVLNERLSSSKTGWTKYVFIKFDKPHSTNNSNTKVLSILYLMHAIETDVIIARVIRKQSKTNAINIRYCVMTPAKNHQCSNLKELNQYMVNHHNYNGRLILVKDFNP